MKLPKLPDLQDSNTDPNEVMRTLVKYAQSEFGWRQVDISDMLYIATTERKINDKGDTMRVPITLGRWLLTSKNKKRVHPAYVELLYRKIQDEIAKY